MIVHKRHEIDRLYDFHALVSIKSLTSDASDASDDILISWHKRLKDGDTFTQTYIFLQLIAHLPTVEVFQYEDL